MNAGRLIELLEGRNICLVKIHEASQNILKNDNFEPDSMNQKRAALFHVLECFDQKISAIVPLIPPEERVPVFREKVKQLMMRSDQLLALIQKTDQALMGRIEQEKTRLETEFNSFRKERSNIGRFRSNWANQSGSELDCKL